MLLFAYMDRHKGRKIQLVRRRGIWQATVRNELGRIVRRVSDASLRTLTARLNMLTVEV